MKSFTIVPEMSDTISKEDGAEAQVRRASGHGTAGRGLLRASFLLCSLLEEHGAVLVAGLCLTGIPGYAAFEGNGPIACLECTSNQGLAESIKEAASWLIRIGVCTIQ